VEAGHETVPIEAGARPRGLLVSFEVDDVDAVAAVAHELGCRFVLEPVRELGQRHFMVADPDGAVVDVIERVDLDADDRRRLVRHRMQHRRDTAP
jgi:catechol 2,3-dioxygenase-like lactoylglutathione lyase family enzyme